MNTHKAPSRDRQRLERTSSAASSLAAVLTLVFLPKCPLCIAAYLTGLGLGSAAAAFAAPVVRPLAVVLAVMAGAALLRCSWHYYRRRGATRKPHELLPAHPKAELVQPK